jgi:type III pantothenate kinase
MLLAIDIGNTNTVAGAFENDALIDRWRITTDARRMPDEYAALFDTLFRMSGLRPQFDGVVIGSVVPGVQAAIAEVVRRYWKIEPLVLSPKLDFGIEVTYTPPQAVGADRVANAAAAIHAYGTPAIVVDFGTATTFDAISRDAVYVGGAIAPGLEISQEALFSRTAQLPRIPLEAPPSAIGTTTLTSLQSGILYGYAGLVDGLVERIRASLGAETIVIATGGLAGILSPLTTTIRHVDPDLTLVGLRLLYERNTLHADYTRIREA